MANAAFVRKEVVSSFKLHGLSLKTDASKFLTEVLSTVSEVELEDWLEKIVEAVQKQPLHSSLVDRDIVEVAVQECSEDPEEDTDKAFCVIDAFQVPRFIYNPDRKKFIPSPCSDTSLHAQSNSKAELYRQRYVIHVPINFKLQGGGSGNLRKFDCDVYPQGRGHRVNKVGSFGMVAILDNAFNGENLEMSRHTIFIAFLLCATRTEEYMITFPCPRVGDFNTFNNYFLPQVGILIIFFRKCQRPCLH